MEKQQSQSSLSGEQSNVVRGIGNHSLEGYTPDGTPNANGDIITADPDGLPIVNGQTANPERLQ